MKNESQVNAAWLQWNWKHNVFKSSCMKTVKTTGILIGSEKHTIQAGSLLQPEYCSTPIKTLLQPDLRSKQCAVLNGDDSFLFRLPWDWRGRCWETHAICWGKTASGPHTADMSPEGTEPAEKTSNVRSSFLIPWWTESIVSGLGLGVW